MPIKHLVITGGGPYGLCSFGILGHLKEQGVFDPDQIESVYATSIGCMVGLFMVLKNISYEEIREYVIHKPVCEQFALTSDHIFNLYSNKGVYDGVDVVKRFLEPIFHAENISPEVTMREFYEHSGVSLNFICSDVNNGFAEYRISHDTHPDLPIYPWFSTRCMWATRVWWTAGRSPTTRFTYALRTIKGVTPPKLSGFETCIRIRPK
jgi:hypothetical protein